MGLIATTVEPKRSYLIRFRQLHAEHQVSKAFDFDIAEDSDEVTVVKLIASLFEDAIQE